MVGFFWTRGGADGGGSLPTPSIVGECGREKGIRRFEWLKTQSDVPFRLLSTTLKNNSKKNRISRKTLKIIRVLNLGSVLPKCTII